MELTETDMEISIDKDIRWTDCAVGVAVCMQPGDSGSKAMRPGN